MALRHGSSVLKLDGWVKPSHGEIGDVPALFAIRYSPYPFP